MYFDVIVIGGGHAGVETRFVSRQGLNAALLLLERNHWSDVVQSSHRRLGKSHLVKRYRC